MLPDIQPGNTKILYFFNCLLDGMHTTSLRRRLFSFDKFHSSIIAIFVKIQYNIYQYYLV